MPDKLKNNKQISNRHIWSVLCTRSTHDTDTNELSLVNVIDQILIGFPPGFDRDKSPLNINIPFELVTFWQKKQEDPEDYTHSIQIELIDPTGSISRVSPLDVKFAPQTRRVRMRVRIEGIEGVKYGTYNISVKEKIGKNYLEVARIPLDVKEKID